MAISRDVKLMFNVNVYFLNNLDISQLITWKTINTLAVMNNAILVYEHSYKTNSQQIHHVWAFKTTRWISDTWSMSRYIFVFTCFL